MLAGRLAFDFTRVRKRAKPAVVLRVQRRVRRHAGSPEDSNEKCTLYASN